MIEGKTKYNEDLRKKISPVINVALTRKDFMTEVLDLRGACEYLRLAKSTLYKYVGLGVIPSFRVGKCLRFKKEILDDWMRKQSEENASRIAKKQKK